MGGVGGGRGGGVLTFQLRWRLGGEGGGGRWEEEEEKKEGGMLQPSSLSLDRSLQHPGSHFSSASCGGRRCSAPRASERYAAGPQERQLEREGVSRESERTSERGEETKRVEDSVRGECRRFLSTAAAAAAAVKSRERGRGGKGTERQRSAGCLPNGVEWV